MHRAIFLSGAFLLLLCASRTNAYQNADHHYSFTPPSGWVETSAAEANRPRGTGPAPHYDIGFKPQGIPTIGGITYVLVQFEDKAVTLDDFGADLDRMRTHPSALPPNVTYRSGKIDRDHKRSVMELDIKGRGQMLHCRTYSNIGKESIVHVHCYTDQSPISAMAPAFDQVANTFNFDEGFGNAEASSAAVPAAGGSSSGGLTAGLIGVGGVVVVGLFIFGGKKSAKR